MKILKQPHSVDAVAEPDDVIQVEIQDRPQGKVLYIHVNGETIFRVGQIKSIEVVGSVNLNPNA